ncbi:MAG: hypothetical protein ACRDIY_13895 [Chloroflexota bacterium]
MPKELSSPYHLSPHSAPVLLTPIGGALGELEARLTQYVDRIPMPDADRETVSQALSIVSQARRRIVELATSQPTAG